MTTTQGRTVNFEMTRSRSQAQALMHKGQMSRSFAGTQKPHYVKDKFCGHLLHRDYTSMDKQMEQIEYRIQSARRRRELQLSSHKNLSTVDAIDHKIKEAQHRLKSLNEKHEYHVLDSVVLKHHNKEKKMKKKAKEEQEIKDFEMGKKNEESQQFQNKLK